MMMKLRKKAQKGFTLIELMIVVAIIGILAAVAIPAFMKYIKKSKTSEARANVQKIYTGAREYYMDRNTTGGAAGMSASAQVPQFPAPSTALTADAGCCAIAGAGGTEKCTPNASQWETTVWQALKFGVSDPHYYAYQYTVNSNPGAVDGSDNFSAIAVGDLDCDGTQARYTMYGVIDSTYSDGPAGTAAISRTNDLE